MSSFGQELKRERELRDISLKEISEATKISIRFLEALEQDNFDILPGGVFNRGFIRAYARFIGIDGEEMVNAYLHEVSLREQRRAAEGREPAPAPTAPAPAPSAPPAPPRNRGGRPRAEGYLDGIRSESLAGLRARDASASTGRRAVLDVVEGHASAALWAIAVIAFLVGAGMITLNVLQRTSEASPPDAHAQAARARQARLARSGSGAATDDPAASAGAEAAPQAPPPGDSNAPSDAATAPRSAGRRPRPARPFSRSRRPTAACRRRTAGRTPPSRRSRQPRPSSRINCGCAPRRRPR